MDFLVVDDDKTFRDAASLLIEEEGHHAQPAGSGPAALENLQEENFDAVLLDVNLGEESGLDLLPQMLRSQASLAVVMLTAQGSVDLAVEAMRRGAVDFLEKPFTREQFHRVLARAQRFSQMSRSIERLEREVKESKMENPELLLDFACGPMREVMGVVEKAAHGGTLFLDEIGALPMEIQPKLLRLLQELEYGLPRNGRSWCC